VDCGPAPTGNADGESLFWRHERLHRRVATDPTRLLPLYAAEREAIEARWFAEPPASQQAFAEGDEALRRWTERVRGAVGTDRRPWWVRRYWRRRNAAARLQLR
jgi:secernin